MKNAVDAATQYASSGYRVLPLHGIRDGRCTCGKTDCPSPGKHPRTAHGVKDASDDPDVIRHWWSRYPDANVGIAVGHGVLVLDIDPDKGGLDSIRGKALPDASPCCRTGGGGWHYWFRVPDGVATKNATSVLPGIDIRTDGGYVVAPPSRHQTGRYYEWEQPLVPPDELPPAPDWLVQLLAAAKTIRQAAVASWGEGTRHETALALAGVLRKRGVPQPEAEAIIREIACEARDPELEDRLRAVRDTYAKPPESVAGFSRLPQQLREAVDAHLRNGHDHEHTEGVRVMTKFVPRRFTEKILHQHRFYSCGDLRTGDFYRYDPEAGVWREDAEAFLANLLREGNILPEEWKRESHVREIVADVRGLCWHESPLPTPPPTLIPFANGVCDLHAGVLRDHTPEDGFTSKLPWRYEPDAHSELLAVRLGAFPEAIQTHFWEFLAYCLWRGYPLQRAFFWIGKGSAGKSYLMKCLMTALGRENVVNATLHDLSENRFAVAQLHRKLLAFSGELRYDDLAQTDTLKSLTGGDLLTADRKYREPVTFRNHAKLLFTGNALPMTHDRTDAFYRRAFIVRFEHQFAEDPRIETELELLPPNVKAREFSWLLTQAVAVLQRLLENGFQMTGDVSVAEKRKMYEELSDPLQQFIEECCVRTRRTDDYVFKYEFNDRLNEWLQARGLNQYQTRRVNQRMRELGFEESRKGHEKYWAWIGLKWREVPEVPEVPDSTNRSKLASNRVVNIGTSGTLGTEPRPTPSRVSGWCGVCGTTTAHRPYRLMTGDWHWECTECGVIRPELPDAL